MIEPLTHTALDGTAHGLKTVTASRFGMAIVNQQGRAAICCNMLRQLLHGAFHRRCAFDNFTIIYRVGQAGGQRI